MFYIEKYQEFAYFDIFSVFVQKNRKMQFLGNFDAKRSSGAKLCSQQQAGGPICTFLPETNTEGPICTFSAPTQRARDLIENNSKTRGPNCNPGKMNSVILPGAIPRACSRQKKGKTLPHQRDPDSGRISQNSKHESCSS